MYERLKEWMERDPVCGKGERKRKAGKGIGEEKHGGRKGRGVKIERERREGWDIRERGREVIIYTVQALVSQ